MSDHAKLTGRALLIITKLLRQKPGDWNDIDVVVHKKTYKVEWTGDLGRLTLYDSGEFSFEDNRGDCQESSIKPLHDDSWVNQLVKLDVDRLEATFAVDFFKQIVGQS